MPRSIQTAITPSQSAIGHKPCAMRKPAFAHFWSSRQHRQQSLPFLPANHVFRRAGAGNMPYHRNDPLLHRQPRDGVDSNSRPAEQLRRAPNKYRIETLRGRKHAHGKFEIGYSLQLVATGRLFFEIIVRLTIVPTAPVDGQPAQIMRLRQP